MFPPQARERIRLTHGSICGCVRIIREERLEQQLLPHCRRTDDRSPLQIRRAAEIHFVQANAHLLLITLVPPLGALQRHHIPIRQRQQIGNVVIKHRDPVRFRIIRIQLVRVLPRRL